MPDRNLRGQIDNLRERIQTSNQISQNDKDLLLEFSNRLDLLQSRISDNRHKDLLGNTTRLAENVGGLSDALTDRDAAADIVRYIRATYSHPETNRDYRDALRQLGEHMTDCEGKPDSIDWIPSSLPTNYDPAPNPADMLKWDDDIKPMIEHTRNARDAAIIATAWNLGARPFEFQDITIGDITDSAHGLQVTVDGKKGQRSPTLILAVPYLQRWLDDHPAPTDRTAPLWSKLTKPEPISSRMHRKLLQEAADRAEITKPVTLSNFRKSCASYLAAQNVNQVNLENHMGWTRSSTIAARYIAVFSGETEREIARAYGANVQDVEPDPLSPIVCTRCNRDNPPDKDRCMWCGQLLDPAAIETVKDNETNVQKALLKLINKHPNIIDDIERAQELMDLLDTRPELEEEIVELAETLTNA